jgi:prepilin-type N-terminal cleavage/methylation domain-containing protein
MAYSSENGFMVIDLRAAKRGFTLIELSIVLVIIGLIAGGVLVGRDLISAAAIRAQISQVEKYSAAVNTFRSKYGYLPGDIPDPAAQQYGFLPRGTDCGGNPCPGEGDGNGIIEGIQGISPGDYYFNYTAAFAGESAMVWVDLGTAGLIDNRLTTATPTATPGLIQGPDVAKYFPAARIDNGNYIAVWSGGYQALAASQGVVTYAGTGDGQNYFAIGGFLTNDNPAYGPLAEGVFGPTAITPVQAYSIDMKLDDGLPQTGNVTAMNLGGYYTLWSAGGQNSGDFDPTTKGPVVAGDGIATQASDTTCYDNSDVPGGIEQYSIGYKNGEGLNCALSFKFQ